MPAYTYVWYVDNIPRYVGCASNSGNRWYQHTYPKRSHFSNYIRARLKDGADIRVQILPTPTFNEAQQQERLLIAQHGREDTGAGTLLNHTDGGEGSSGRLDTLEVRAKRAASVSASRRSTPASDAQREASRCARLGKSHTAETKRRISESNKGKNLGRRHKPDSVAKRSKQCTVDGVTIFPSLRALMRTLGRGANGAGSQNLRFINADNK